MDNWDTIKMAKNWVSKLKLLHICTCQTVYVSNYVVHVRTVTVFCKNGAILEYPATYLHMSERFMDLIE